MKRILSGLIFMLMAMSITFHNSMAQGINLKGIGGRLSVVDPEGTGGTIGFGGHLHLGEVIPFLVLYPSLEYWSKSSISSFTINGDVRYYFPTPGNIDFFAGGGLAISFISIDLGNRDENDTDIGLNLLGGADFPVSENLVATAKLKYLVSDRNVLKITGGITYLFRK